MILVAVHSAIKCNIFSLLEKRPRSLSSVLGECRSVELQGKLSALIALLIQAGYLSQIKRSVGLAPKSRALLSNKAMQDYLDWRFYSLQHEGNTPALLRGGISTIFRQNLYSHLEKDAPRYARFQNAMHAVAAPAFPEIVRLATAMIPEDKKLQILELGAGNGSLSRAILCKHPLCSVHIIDLHSSAALKTNRRFVRDGRCQVKRGNFTETAWPKCDVLLACDTLSNLSASDLEATLVQARKNGCNRFVFFEPLADHPHATESSALSGFILATETDGFVRTSRQWREVLRDYTASISLLAEGFACITGTPKK